MNRVDLHRLSNARMRESRVLFSAGEYSGAYYLAGYAVECGLKACLAKRVKRHDFPDLKDSKRAFTHNLADLEKLASVDNQMSATRQGNPELKARWEVVCRWSEESRYYTWTKDAAETLIDAVSKRKAGVLPWIKRYW
jgi:HEPN domain-containing protein